MGAIDDPARGQVSYDTMPDRVAGAREAGVQLRDSDICYTDLLGAETNLGASAFPVVPGHENAGVVAEVGPMALSLGIALKTLGVSEIVFADIEEARMNWTTEFGFRGSGAGSDDLENLHLRIDLAVDTTGVLGVAAGLVDGLANGGKRRSFTRREGDLSSNS